MGNTDLNGVEKSVYWANHRTEIMFHVTPMLPSGRQVLDDAVAVLWVEEQPNYDFTVRPADDRLPYRSLIVCAGLLPQQVPPATTDCYCHSAALLGHVPSACATPAGEGAASRPNS